MNAILFEWMKIFWSNFSAYFSIQSLLNKFYHFIPALYWIVGYLFIEMIITGWRSSSIRSLTSREKSSQLDFISFVAYIFNFRKVFANLFTFGLAAYLSRELNLRLDFFSDFPMIGKLILMLAMYDFLHYWYHRFMHQTRCSWIVHEFHHSAEELSSFTAFRGHPLNFPFLFILVTFPVEVVFKPNPLEETVFFVITIMVGVFIHGRIDCDFGFLGRWVINSPRLHYLHHSMEGEERNGNFGEILIVWDRLFGTYIPPVRHLADIRCGINENRSRYEGGLIRAFGVPALIFYRLLFMVILEKWLLLVSVFNKPSENRSFEVKIVGGLNNFEHPVQPGVNKHRAEELS